MPHAGENLASLPQELVFRGPLEAGSEGWRFCGLVSRLSAGDHPQLPGQRSRHGRHAVGPAESDRLRVALERLEASVWTNLLLTFNLTQVHVCTVFTFH